MSGPCGHGHVLYSNTSGIGKHRLPTEGEYNARVRALSMKSTWYAICWFHHSGAASRGPL